VLLLALTLPADATFSVTDVRLYEYDLNGQPLSKQQIQSLIYQDGQIYGNQLQLLPIVNDQQQFIVKTEQFNYSPLQKIMSLTQQFVQCIVGCQADANDSSIPMQLKSDNATIKDNQISYFGSVLLQYANLEIKAETLIISIDDNQKLTAFQALGTPIFIKDSTMLEAETTELTFSERNQVLTLYGNPVSIQYQDHFFSSSKVEYKLNDQSIVISDSVNSSIAVPAQTTE